MSRSEATTNGTEVIDQLDDCDQFEDASSSFAPESLKDSDGSGESQMKLMAKALEYMLNNRYYEAEAFLKPQSDESCYCCAGYGTILFLQAMISLERECIDQANSVLTKAVSLCNEARRKQTMLDSLSGMMFGRQLNDYTFDELQAEILYAECNMLLSLLTFFQDESLTSFIKAGLKIRSCYGTYKQLYAWVCTCEQEGVDIEPNFAAGVRLGIGCFNLIISLLPGRVLKLLEFVGFSGDRLLGLQELTRGARTYTFRAPMCSAFLLFYHTVVSVMLGVGDIDVDVAEGLLLMQMEHYPKSVLFLYFRGRVELLKGSVDNALAAFTEALEMQEQWKQIHHLCWWELKWCHCFKGEWKIASSYADKLYNQSRWSKATFLYQKAAFLLMLRDNGPSSSSQAAQTGDVAPGVSHDDITEMMKAVPPLKQRIAGKSIPVEKFAVAKSERYINGCRLPLCGMEMIYAWNGFNLLARNKELLSSMLLSVWAELPLIEEGKDDNPCYDDDWCVVNLLMGVCMRGLERYDEAERCFLNIVDRAPQLQYDSYLAPAANLELGLLCLDMQRLDEAESYLEKTKLNYKGYHLESRIHFRVHSGLCRVAQMKASST